MTQRTVFKKEMIIEAAFQLTREQGWGAVTARNIAQKLGSSTMPLYSSLKSMDEIEKEVRIRAQSCMQEHQRRKYTENTLLNSAIGYVTFARDERNLFRFLYVDRPLTANRPGEPGQARDVVALDGVVDLADQAVVALKDPVVLYNWAFTHGLASLISGCVIDLPEERISAIIQEVSAAIYLFSISDMKKLMEGGKKGE